MYYRLPLPAVFLLVLLGFAPSVPAHEPAGSAAASSETLRVSARPAAALVDAFHSALQRGDEKAAAALLADDVIIFEAGEAERSKTEYLAVHLAADIGFEQAVPSSATRRTGGASGDMA